MTLVVPGGAATQGYGKVADEVLYLQHGDFANAYPWDMQAAISSYSSAADTNEIYQWRWKVPRSGLH